MKNIHVRVEGRVQGVFFRDYTRKKATTLGIKGWVKNMPDGAVEAVLCGPKTVIADMISWLHTGSPHSSVSKVIVNDLHSRQEFSDFQIIF